MKADVGEVDEGVREAGFRNGGGVREKVRN